MLVPCSFPITIIRSSGPYGSWVSSPRCCRKRKIRSPTQWYKGWRSSWWVVQPSWTHPPGVLYLWGLMEDFQRGVDGGIGQGIRRTKQRRSFIYSSRSEPIFNRPLNLCAGLPISWLLTSSLFIQIYLKMYPVSFPCGLLHDIYRKQVVSLYGASPTASSQVVS